MIYIQKLLPLAAMISGLFLTSCSNDAEPYGESIAKSYYITVSNASSNLTLDLERSANIQVIDSKRLGWEANTREDWLKLGKPNNSASYFYGRGSSDLPIQITEDNTSSQARTATIRLRCDRFYYNYYNETEITVTQAGGYITVPESVSFPAMSSEQTITVKSNVAWEINYPYSTISSVSPTKGSPGTTSVTLRSFSNTKAQDRTGSITISPTAYMSAIPSQDISFRIEKVTLEATVANDNTHFTASGGSFKLNITSNFNWTIDGLDSWLSPNKTSGTGNQTVNFTVAQNTGSSRWSYFRVKAGEVETWVGIDQDGLPTPNEEDNITPRYTRKN